MGGATDYESNGVRLEGGAGIGDFWQAHTAAGSLALGAVVLLVVIHRAFRNHLGG